MTRLSDIAQELGLNIATVSRALRDDSRVKADTRALVKETAARLGYRPHWGARALAEGRSRTFWLLTPGLESPIEREPASWAGRWLLARGYDLLLAQHWGDRAVYERLMDRLAHGGADGALVIPCLDRHGDPSPDLRALAQGVPLVYLDRRVEGAEAPWVGTDNLRAVRDQLASLAASAREGTRPVRWVFDRFEPGLNHVEADRSAGLRAAAADLGLRVFDQEHPPGPEEAGLPGIFFGSRIAEVRETADGLGRGFPENRGALHRAAVFDEGTVPEAGFLEVSVVRQDFRGLGEAAARLLLEKLAETGTGPGDLCLPPLGNQVSREKE